MLCFCILGVSIFTIGVSEQNADRVLLVDTFGIDSAEGINMRSLSALCKGIDKTFCSSGDISELPYHRDTKEDPQLKAGGASR